MQVQKNLLSQLLRQRPIAQEVTRHAEHHSLVLTNDLLEGKLIAKRRPFKRVIEPGCRSLIQCDCSFPPHHALVRNRFADRMQVFGEYSQKILRKETLPLFFSLTPN